MVTDLTVETYQNERERRRTRRENLRKPTGNNLHAMGTQQINFIGLPT